MPTYEYACTECSTRLEVVQSFREDPLTTCEVCGGRLRKVFSPAGIIFKGSGYYVNDSRAQKAGGDRADRADTGDGKSDKKAATAGEGAGSSERAASSDGGKSTSGNGAKSDGGGKSSDGAGSASSKSAATKPT